MFGRCLPTPDARADTPPRTGEARLGVPPVRGAADAVTAPPGGATPGTAFLGTATPDAAAPGAATPVASPPSAARGGEPGARPARAIGAALLVAGVFFMENLDATVIASVLPQMGASFGVDPVALNIGMSAYMLALGVFIPVSGWLADTFGARRVFGLAIVIFTVSSVLCGLAPNLPTFVAMRVLQGFGGALMVPVGRLVVLSNTPKQDLITTIAIITWPALVAPLLGPPVGGLFAEHLSWRWIFFLNLPLGVIAFAAALVLIPDPPRPPRRPFDWTGFTLCGGGLMLLLYVLETGVHAQQPVAVLALLAAAGAGLIVVALRHLSRAAHPLFRLHGLSQTTFRVALWGGSFFRMATSSVPFLLPLMLQVGFGLDAVDAGLMLMAVFAGNIAMKPMTTPLLRRFGFRRVMLVNGALNALFLMSCATFTPDTPVAMMIALLFAGGLTRSMQFTALNTIAFADMPQTRMNDANTLFSTVMQLTVGMGITVGAITVRIGEAVAPALGLADWPAADFRIAFLVVGGVALVTLVDTMLLPADAGTAVTGVRGTPRQGTARHA